MALPKSMNLLLYPREVEKLLIMGKVIGRHAKFERSRKLDKQKHQEEKS